VTFRPARNAGRAVLAALALAVVLVLPAAAFNFPALTGRVVDQAGIIPPAEESALDAKLAALEAATTDQFVVVTLKSLEGTDIADYGYQLGRHWGIGQKDKNNGVLLIVAPNERSVRIEVGYGLEGDLTDAVSRLIIENAILPKFRSGDMAAGIAAGADDVIKVLSGDAPAFKEKAAAKRDAPSGGDGAWFPVVFFLFVVVIIILSNIGRRRRRRGPWGWVVGPGSFGSGSGWSGGSSGGGFSGGGGSFGGGGSSGSW
jgi:uncharacterized protein